MSTPTSTKPMVIDINSLSIEELSALQQQFDAELVFFNDSLNELRSVAGKFGRCRATLDSINSDEKDKPALVPLSESVYVRAKMSDPDKYLVEIGTGYFVEMERKRAAEYFKRKYAFLESQVETITRKVIPEKQQARQTIAAALQKKDLRCNPHSEFLLRLFQSKKRVDGRAWDEFRVICSIEAEIITPRKKPGAGSISFALDFLPMAHPSAVDSSTSSDSEVEQCLSMLESLYRDTYCIDFETLCIEINKYVFDIKCTIKVLDYDGGLFDICTLAVSTALMGFRRNDVTFNAVTKKLISHSSYDKALVPLTLYYKPATITFGFINGIDEPMVDPTLEEASLIEGSLTIGANHRNEICLMHQCGNLKIDAERIKACCDSALQNVRELSKEINTACAKPVLN
uniref:Exosome complex component RRP45 n=1 Tax=Globodera rostochiensis TaxID=31243 RepID=A0A914GWZ8_GLORO